MNETKTVPDWAWNLFQAKQGEAHKCPNDAAEETLNYLVRIFNTGEIPENERALERMIDNHLAGERQKLRRRRKILENVAATSSSTSDVTTQRISSVEALNIIRSNVTRSQWQLLHELAGGDSYRQLSNKRGLSVGTAKSHVCRIRKRLRALFCQDESMSMAA